jgi:hypothetical protein
MSWEEEEFCWQTLLANQNLLRNAPENLPEAF